MLIIKIRPETLVSDGRIEINYLKVLAEFGVDVKDDKTTQQESKKKKKKAKDDTSKNDAPELSEVVSAFPEPSEPESKEAGVDENAKEEALKKLAAKGKGKGKGGAKSVQQSGIYEGVGTVWSEKMFFFGAI